MLKKFKNVFRVLLIALIITMSVTACNNNNDNNGNSGDGGNTSVTVTRDMLQALPFEDLTVAYDGLNHSILIDNIYESSGVKITYTGNEQSIPGTYNISAAIKCDGVKTVYKNAVLTITKGVTELSAASVQTANTNLGPAKVEYTINNNSNQKLVTLDKDGNQINVADIITPGVYELEVYLAGNIYYNESNHVNVSLTVIKSQFEVAYETKRVVADGAEHTVELTGTLPSGYTVEYENNKGTVDGTYYALAKIKDSSGTVVEIHRACLIIDNPENAEFAQYLDDFFVWYLEGDQLSVNIFCENPVDFGLEHYDAKWYTYESFGEEEIAHDLQLFKDMLDELLAFEDALLNDLQESIYETVRKFLEYNVEYYSIEDVFFMELNYVDQFGGYVADFGTYMESYSLRTEAEVNDVVDYLESTRTAFPSYLDFIQDKVEKGYPLSDYTITEMRNYLKDILDQGADYYLKDILYAKIDAVDFLTTAQKSSYKAEIATAISQDFITGVEGLYDGLEGYLGILAEEDEGYLASYENGKELYVLDLGKLLGYEDLDTQAYIEELDYELKAAVRKVVSLQQNIVSTYGISTYEELEAIVNSAAITVGTPEVMMEYLKEFAKTIVPELESNPDIVIKEMDEASAKVSNAVAYYMKSALDNTGSEYITLNPVQLSTSSPSDTLGTLAHEGYPGHLYAYVYSKELGLSNLATIMTSTAHAEGWATYVQLKLYEYAKELSDDPKFDLIMNYLYANQISGYLLESRLDAGIQLEGWGVQDVASYMSYVGYNGEAAQEIYDLLVEIPTQYVSYGYGKLVFVKLHEEAKKILGVHYDEIEFNAMLLSKGWTDLSILEDTYEEYMSVKCHELGLTFR